MRDRPDDLAIRRDLGRRLDADIRFALVILYDQFIFVLGLRILVAQTNRKIGRVAPADTVHGHAAGQRTNEADFDFVLCRGLAGDRHPHRERRDEGNPTVFLTDPVRHSPSFLSVGLTGAAEGSACT